MERTRRRRWRRLGRPAIAIVVAVLIAAQAEPKPSWLTDYVRAREESRKSGRLIFAYFTRPDPALPLASVLENTAFSNPAFSEFAKKVVLFRHAGGKAELGLPAVSDPPQLFFLDSDGNLIVRHQGPRTVRSFDETRARVLAMLDAKKKAEGGDKPARIEEVLLRLELGTIGIDEARRQLSGLGVLSPEQLKRLNACAVDAEILAVVRGIKPGDKASVLAAAREFQQMRTAGKLPTGERETMAFWMCLLEQAEGREDARTFEEGIAALKAKFGAEPETRGLFEKLDQALKKLKAR